MTDEMSAPLKGSPFANGNPEMPENTIGWAAFTGCGNSRPLAVHSKTAAVAAEGGRGRLDKSNAVHAALKAVQVVVPEHDGPYVAGRFDRVKQARVRIAHAGVFAHHARYARL